MNIMYDYEKVFQVLSIKFKENPEFKIEEKNADFLLKSAIENDDLELIKLLLQYKVSFSEDILDFIGFSNEFVFCEIIAAIDKNQSDFSWENLNSVIFDLSESHVSTPKMFSILLEKKTVEFNKLYKNEIPLLIFLCINRKSDVLKFLIENKFILRSDLNLKYSNLIFLEYVERYMPYDVYISLLKLFNLT